MTTLALVQTEEVPAPVTAVQATHNALAAARQFGAQLGLDLAQAAEDLVALAHEVSKLDGAVSPGVLSEARRLITQVQHTPNSLRSTISRT